MLGKTTFMKAVGITCLLAHIGCFVPAKEAFIPIYDQILSHRSSGDDEIEGMSSFMSDMLDTSRILRYSTKNSLVILDEIGIGTSPVAGLAIFVATLSKLVFKVGCTVLCVTHFHEISKLNSNIWKSNEDIDVDKIQFFETTVDSAIAYRVTPMSERSGTSSSHALRVADNLATRSA